MERTAQSVAYALRRETHADVCVAMFTLHEHQLLVVQHHPLCFAAYIEGVAGEVAKCAGESRQHV